MQNAPKGLRLQIGIFGRTNVGKSTFLNMVAGQDVAITSPVPGTTTDVVEKTMELLPVGPVVFLDTAGIDDVSILSKERIQKTKKIYDRADVIALVLEPDQWTDFEEEVCAQALKKKIPVIAVVNKADLKMPSDEFLSRLRDRGFAVLVCASVNRDQRDPYVHDFKQYLLKICPEDFISTPALIGDILPKGSIGILIVPIDFEAPKGRIILPQVQAIRDALDHDAAVIVVKESEYKMVLKNLKQPPALVVCDSQVVDQMVKDTPEGILCTTFSILLARFKGELREFVKGARMIDELKSGDHVLIAEACSHHAIEGDIGRQKIPRWIKEYTGCDVNVDVRAGRDYPTDLRKYKLIIHCGACMLTRREVLTRMNYAMDQDVAITNYGVTISFLKGVLERVLEPFEKYNRW